jgi:hypothetical protein
MQNLDKNQLRNCSGWFSTARRVFVITLSFWDYLFLVRQQFSFLKGHISLTNLLFMKTILILFAALLLYSCAGKPFEAGEVDAWVPIYSNPTDAVKISNSAPQPFVNGGKIATQGNTLYQVEQDKGIHIINISNPAAPVKTGFINIALCRELTLKGNWLYTNNMTDLVVLDVSNPASTPVATRIANAFPNLGVQFPPDAATGTYFECADAAKGTVIRWELQKIKNPKCRR